MSTDITEEVQVQTHLYKQDKLDKILQIRLPFFFFFFNIYKFVSTRHRELWNTILQAIYDNLCSLGVCKFPSQALTPIALTTYSQIFYFLSNSSESSPNTAVLKPYHIYQSKTTDRLIKWHHLLLSCVLYFKTELAAPRPGSLVAVTNMHSWAERRRCPGTEAQPEAQQGNVLATLTREPGLARIT